MILPTPRRKLGTFAPLSKPFCVYRSYKFKMLYNLIYNKRIDVQKRSMDLKTTKKQFHFSVKQK